MDGNRTNRIASMKAIALSAVRPSLFAFKQFIQDHVSFTKKLVNKQNESIDNISADVAELNKLIHKLLEQVSGYEKEVAEINKHYYTDARVKELADRCRDLEYICGTLYDKVYELIHNGSVTDPTLPDFNNPQKPGEDNDADDLVFQATEEWYTKNNIPHGQELSEEQQADLAKFVEQYVKEHTPAHPIE